MGIESNAHEDLALAADAERVAAGRNRRRVAPIILRGDHGATAICTLIGDWYSCTLRGYANSNDDQGDRRPK
jgi:hypothetical protein